MGAISKFVSFLQYVIYIFFSWVGKLSIVRVERDFFLFFIHVYYNKSLRDCHFKRRFRFFRERLEIIGFGCVNNFEWSV